MLPPLPINAMSDAKKPRQRGEKSEVKLYPYDLDGPEDYWLFRTRFP
jgi:hypothetical protein